MNLNLYPLLNLIPTNKITTYKELSHTFGLPNHHRYIAQLLSKNPQPNKFPCFKVINSNGTINNYNLGEEEKLKRLKKINITFKKNRLVNFEQKFSKFQTKDYYLSIPLSKEEKEIFHDLQKNLQLILPQIKNFISWQPWQTAHLLTYFLGDKIEFTATQLTKLNKYFVDQKFKRAYIFQWLNYFTDNNKSTLAFLQIPNNFFLQNLKKFTNKLNQDLGFKINLKNNTPNYPHLTLFRITDPIAFKENKTIIEDLVNSFFIQLTLTKIELSATINNQSQFKLISWDLK